MMDLRQLEAFLQENKVVYEIQEHEEGIAGAKDAARYFDPELCAAVYVIETERGLAATIVNAQRDSIDIDALNFVLGYQATGKADPRIVKQATGYEVGFLPLVGHRLPVLFDKALTIHDYIYGCTGDKTHTIKIRPEDVIRLNTMIDFIE